jgi:hypothetical protein
LCIDSLIIHVCFLRGPESGLQTFQVHWKVGGGRHYKWTSKCGGSLSRGQESGVGQASGEDEKVRGGEGPKLSKAKKKKNCKSSN